MSNMTAKRFREKANCLRKAARRLDDGEAREILSEAAHRYEAMASAILAHQAAENRRAAALKWQ